MGRDNFFATFEDHLFGTRSVENQVSTLSNRKEDREGRFTDSTKCPFMFDFLYDTSDVVVNAILLVVLAIRFQSRG